MVAAQGSSRPALGRPPSDGEDTNAFLKENLHPGPQAGG